jgi:hypothetical protein
MVPDTEIYTVRSVGRPLNKAVWRVNLSTALDANGLQKVLVVDLSEEDASRLKQWVLTR